MNDKQNELQSAYQKSLDKVYGEGILTAKSKYINPKAVVVHFCRTCHTNFFARPMWLVTTQPHKCYSSPSEVVNARRKAKGIVTVVSKSLRVDEEIKKVMIRLFKQGTPVRQIGRELNINHKTIDYHLRKQGVK